MIWYPPTITRNRNSSVSFPFLPCPFQSADAYCLCIWTNQRYAEQTEFAGYTAALPVPLEFLTNDFGWSSNEATSSKYSYHSSVSWLSATILSVKAQAYLSSFDVSFCTMFSFIPMLLPNPEFLLHVYFVTILRMLPQSAHL